MRFPAVSSGPVVQRLPLSRHRTWQPVDAAVGPAYSQGSLALSYPLTDGLDSEPRSAALVVVPHGGRAGYGTTTEAWAATLIQAVVEVIASDRPLSQLVRWTSRAVYADIAARQQLVARHRGPTGVRSSRQQVATVRVCQPTPRCAEVAARVVFGGRSRAVAARLDHVNGRWLCTALCFG